MKLPQLTGKKKKCYCRKTINLDELDKFFMEHIAGKKYTFLVLGDRDAVDMNVLKKLGTIREIKLEEIFGH